LRFSNTRQVRDLHVHQQLTDYRDNGEEEAVSTYLTYLLRCSSKTVPKPSQRIPPPLHRLIRVPRRSHPVTRQHDNVIPALDVVMIDPTRDSDWPQRLGAGILNIPCQIKRDICQESSGCEICSCNRPVQHLSIHALCLALRWVNADMRRDSYPRTHLPGGPPSFFFLRACLRVLVTRCWFLFDQVPCPPHLGSAQYRTALHLTS
jgi:hypothetical protein